jgi:hypothetical protein
MYQSITLAKEPRGDLSVVMTFALLGLGVSLWAIGKGAFGGPEYLANLFLLS